MSVKHAVLGLLAKGPSHGYAIRAAFEEQLGIFWELNYGQIYQVLAALENEGLIVRTSHEANSRPRKVYALSPSGRDALHSWLKKPPLASRPFRDDFYVRLLLAEQYGRDELKQLLDREYQGSRERLARLVDTRADTAGVLARQLFTEAAILHAEAEVKALELCRTKLLELSAGIRTSNETATPDSIAVGPKRKATAT
jgi:DNA-binding PadR family transcriptional regulator